MREEMTRHIAMQSVLRASQRWLPAGLAALVVLTLVFFFFGLVLVSNRTYSAILVVAHYDDPSTGEKARPAVNLNSFEALAKGELLELWALDERCTVSSASSISPRLFVACKAGSQSERERLWNSLVTRASAFFDHELDRTVGSLEIRTELLREKRSQLVQHLELFADSRDRLSPDLRTELMKFELERIELDWDIRRNENAINSASYSSVDQASIVAEQPISRSKLFAIALVAASCLSVFFILVLGTMSSLVQRSAK